MSYLHGPRIHFKGRFQADTSTVNNDVRHFDSEHFKASFQELMEFSEKDITKYNGYWNPNGTAAWRLIDCKVQSAVLGDKCHTSASADAAVGMFVGGSNDETSGKLVDLDPQQQMVSQIWGLAVGLQDSEGTAAFSSEFEPAAFSNLWLRQQKATEWFDQQLAAAYQSLLVDVEWGDIDDSPTLQRMKEVSADGILSIRMNVFGYDRTPTAGDYGTGVVVGAIGPASVDEPKLFTFGRHLVPEYKPPNNGPSMVPVNGVGPIDAVVDSDVGALTVDFGHALPVEGSGGTLAPLSDTPLEFGVLSDAGTKEGDVIDSSKIVILGEIPFTGTDWFLTAGIHSYSLADNPEAAKLIGDHPLAIVKRTSDGRVEVLNREGENGLFLKADHFVFRLNPGDESTVDLWASRFGRPLSAVAELKPWNGLMGGAGTNAKLDPKIYKIPNVGTPEVAISYPQEVPISESGKGSFSIKASPSGPGSPRGYIDGQLYGIGYTLKEGRAGTDVNMQYFISNLIWDKYTIPERPKWYQDVAPILQQYSNLYPIMSRGLFDLGSYEHVVQHLRIMDLCFRLPLANPNSMPVTRDMSDNKRATILKWLRSKDPDTGLPPMGEKPPDDAEAPDVPDSGIESLSKDDLTKSSKMEFARLALESNTSSDDSHDQN